MSPLQWRLAELMGCWPACYPLPVDRRKPTIGGTPAVEPCRRGLTRGVAK